MENAELLKDEHAIRHLLRVSSGLESMSIGDELIQNFTGDIYEVISVVDPDTLVETLKTKNIGRVILRYDPPNYYEEQGKIQSNLNGDDISYIFSFKERRIVCRKIN